MVCYKVERADEYDKGEFEEQRVVSPLLYICLVSVRLL